LIRLRPSIFGVRCVERVISSKPSRTKSVPPRRGLLPRFTLKKQMSPSLVKASGDVNHRKSIGRVLASQLQTLGQVDITAVVFANEIIQ